MSRAVLLLFSIVASHSCTYRMDTSLVVLLEKAVCCHRVLKIVLEIND